MTDIRFYSHTKGNYTSFSNFSPHPVVWKGKTYPTSEHLFQALKFIDDPEYAEQIRLAETPTICKRMGQTRSHPLRKDWEDVKDDLMYQIVLKKATQNPDMKEELLSTGDSNLIEAAPNDYYWGEGKDGTGKNMLGKVLMKVREHIQE